MKLIGGLHGAHLRADVLAQIGATALRRAIANRALVTSWPRVVVEGGRQGELWTRSAAAVRAYGPDCALTGPTAAALHGCGAAESGRTHILLPYREHPRPRLGLSVHHSTRFVDDVVQLRGLPVLALDRVVADLLCRARERDALAVCDQALALRPDGDRESWRNRLGERIIERADPRGTRRAQELLAVATGQAGSPAESWLRLTLIELGFPWPEVNWPLRSPWGETIWILDLAWPHLRVAVEYQGYAVHAERGDEDAARFTDLERRGWIVVVAQARDLRDHHDLELRLRDAFARRGHFSPARSA